MVENMKNSWNINFDSSKEGFWCTECNAKNLSSLQSTVYEKIKKTCPKRVKMVKNDCFSRFFLFFFRNGTLQRAEVFCAAFSASKPFIWAIKINNPTIFHIFHPKGGPFWFRGVKILPTPEVEGLERKEKQFYKWHGHSNKMGGCRSCYSGKSPLVITLLKDRKMVSSV